MTAGNFRTLTVRSRRVFIGYEFDGKLSRSQTRVNRVRNRWLALFELANRNTASSNVILTHSTYVVS